MQGNVTQLPRPLKPVPDPLGLYLRPGHADHCQLTTLLLAGHQQIFGAVIDATLTLRQKELRLQLATSKLDVILDPKTQPAATPGGWKRSLGDLPWGSDRPHVPDDFRSL